LRARLRELPGAQLRFEHSALRHMGGREVMT
jgi:hypothetical protein